MYVDAPTTIPVDIPKNPWTVVKILAGTNSDEATAEVPTPANVPKDAPVPKESVSRWLQLNIR